MFSPITNNYNMKTKGPTLMKLFTATGKLKKIFLTTRNVRCVHHEWHGTHRYDIQVSPLTRPCGCIDMLHCCSNPCRYVSEVTWQWWDEYCARNARCTVTSDLLCDIPTHKTTSPPERPFSYYMNSHRLAAEMWTTMKNNLQGEKLKYRFGKHVPYCFPIINFCSPGVHYGTPCIFS